MSKNWKRRGGYEYAINKKIIAMCFAVGMTLMPMGQAFANEEG